MDIILKQFKNRALIARVEDNQAYEFAIATEPKIEDGKLSWCCGDYFGDNLSAALVHFNHWVEICGEEKN